MNIRAVTKSLRTIERNLSEVGGQGVGGQGKAKQDVLAIESAERLVNVAERYLKTIKSGDGYAAKTVMHDMLDALQQASTYPGVDEDGKLWDVMYDALRAARG